MNRLILAAALVLAMCAAPALAQTSHEYAPLQQKELSYKDWTYKNIADNSPVDLRSEAAGKKLVLVVYFAPWCQNWRNEAPFAATLYEKYKNDGLYVIGISEYASRDDVRNYFGPKGPSFKVVSESESREDREKTPHFGYRQKTGDTRKWGSPYNIFFVPSEMTKDGEVVMLKAWVANGELVEADAEQFVRDQLGLKSEKAQK
jgi:thiol-disulfide isomerase/thioredoxin